MTVSASRVKAYEINGGTVVIANNRSIRGLWTGEKTEVDDPETEGVTAYYAPIKFGGGVLSLADEVTADPSYGIANSSAPIAISNDTGRVFAAALASSNVGGLTKKGEGTLTLAEVPLYTGLTTVEDGMLVVPQGTELSYNALSDTNLLSGATITNYAYEANTALTAPATSGSVAYDAPLDIANIASIDASGITLTKGQPYVIASAPAITGCSKLALEAVTLTLPSNVDASKWVLKVLTIGNARCLCVAPKTNPFVILVR